MKWMTNTCKVTYPATVHNVLIAGMMSVCDNKTINTQAIAIRSRSTKKLFTYDKVEETCQRLKHRSKMLRPQYFKSDSNVYE